MVVFGDHGYQLSNHMLICRATDKCLYGKGVWETEHGRLEYDLTTERKIFEFLGLPYLEPQFRSA